MKLYRLKSEAVPFFAEKFATKVFELNTWQETYGVDIKALDEIAEPYLTYGHHMSDNAKTLGGWSLKDGSKFEFTINFPGVKMNEYDHFANGKVVRELMNKIQYQIDRFYQQFANGDQDGGAQ